MAAEEKLAEKVDAFTEEEAAEAGALLFLEDDAEWPDFPPAPPHVMELFKRAMADSEAGRTMSDEEFGRKHGLND